MKVQTVAWDFLSLRMRCAWLGPLVCACIAWVCRSSGFWFKFWISPPPHITGCYCCSIGMSTYLFICCDFRKGPIAADQVYFQYEKASSFAAHKNHRGLKNKFKKRIFANTFLLHKRTIAKRKVKIKFCKTFLWHPKWTRLFLTWFGVSLHFQN